MSLGEFIKFCPECGKVNQTINNENKRPCFDCQVKHASDFHKKFDIDSVDEKQNR